MVLFAIMGFIGGIAHCLIDAKSWDDLKKFEMCKQIFIGGIVGFLYSFLYSDYGYPNTIMSFVSGYMGTDAIKTIIDKFGKKDTK